MIGFLLVDKPAGPTSHDVVDAVRRALGMRKVGHAGTLDPPATGLVVVGVGAATRLLQYVQRASKTYTARGVLGVRTTTLDAAGAVTGTAEVDVSEDVLRATLAAFVGDIDQRPPAVSAVKIEGERAYKRAARGETVEPEPRRVHVYEVELVSFDPPSFDVVIRCSSGTYVRSLVGDVGESLRCGAHVASLRRTAIGSLLVEDATSMDAIDASLLRPVEATLTDIPHVELDLDTARRARHGQRIAGTPAPEGEVLVVGPDGPVGVFECRSGVLRPVTVLS